MYLRRQDDDIGFCFVCEEDINAADWVSYEFPQEEMERVSQNINAAVECLVCEDAYLHLRCMNDKDNRLW